MSVGRVEHLAQHLRLPLVVGGRVFLVHSETRHEGFGDVEARELLQRGHAENRVQLRVVVASETDHGPVRRELAEKVHDRDGVGDYGQVVDFGVHYELRQFVRGRRRVEKDYVAFLDFRERFSRRRRFFGASGDDAFLIVGAARARGGDVVVDDAASHAFDGVALGEQRDVAVGGGGTYLELLHQLSDGAGSAVFDECEHPAQAYVFHGGYYNDFLSTKARAKLTSSAYSRSLPTGIP